MSTESVKGNGVPDVKAGTTARDGMDGVSLVRSAETASSALAAQATAEIQAMYLIAMKNPRDWDNVRTAVLAHCKRPRFAAKARYSKPVGGKFIEGPSIRLAETCLQSMGNVKPNAVVIFDDDTKRIVKVSVTDLEKNVTHSGEIVIEKTVERSHLKEGQQPIAVRTNSYGKRVYIVPATEDDIRNKQGNLTSKELRTHSLRLVPADIIEDCMDAVLATQEKEDQQDPNAARKKIVDAFADLGVKPSEIKEYLGHPIEATTPPEMAHLRAVYAAIRDRETTWKEAFELKTKGANPGEAKVADLKSRAKEKAEKSKAAPAPDQKPAEPTKPSPNVDSDGVIHDDAGRDDAAAEAHFAQQGRQLGED
jgi:hypothetical protein